jgi:hypothetical protein
MLAYAADVNILGGSVHTVKENAEALVVATKETTGTRTNVVCFRGVLLSRVKALGTLAATNNHPFSVSLRGSTASKAQRLGKLMTFNSYFNYKRSEYIGVFG